VVEANACVSFCVYPKRILHGGLESQNMSSSGCSTRKMSIPIMDMKIKEDIKNEHI